MRIGRGIAVVLVALAALTVAGCGGGGNELTKAQYEQRVQADAKALGTAFSSIGTAVTTPAQLKTVVADAKKELEKAAADLASLKPPQDARDANQKFVAGLRAVEKQLTALSDALQKGDIASMVTLAQKLSQSKELAAAQQAANDLQKKGYDLGGFGS